MGIWLNGKEVVDGSTVSGADYVYSGPDDADYVDRAGGDLYVKDDLEVDGHVNCGAGTPGNLTPGSGTAFFDGAVEFDASVFFDGNATFLNRCLWSASSSTSGGILYGIDDGLRIFAGQNENQGNNNIIITNGINSGNDHDHDTLSADPSMHFHSGKSPNDGNQDFGTITKVEDGAFKISSNTGNIQLAPTTGITEVCGNGLLTKESSETVADEGTISLPDATAGTVVVSSGANVGWFLVQTDGTVSLISSGGSVAATDSDTNLCVYQSSTQAIIKNRLGASGTVRYSYKYSA